jgi:4-amino-4-deoxy-L-arabinose transferase-like glycosyltransferase
MTPRLVRVSLAFILGIYLFLAVGYGIITPLFETPDEHLHFFTAEFIAREQRLPTTRDGGLMGQEAAQPPLYYALASLLVRMVPAGDASRAIWPNGRTDTSAVVGRLWPNPEADPQDPRGESRANPPINVNMFIHTANQAWPWRGYALAAHLIRIVSAIFGLGTLLSIFAAGRVVWPEAPERALVATGLVAFLPQFAFLHGAVTNDVAVIFFSSAAIWQLLRLVQQDPAVERRSNVGAYLLLGLTIGLAMLSKAAGIILMVYVVAVLGLQTLLTGRALRWRQALTTTGLIILPALLVAGWLLWRNWTLYGDPTAANQFVLIAGGERPFTLRQVWNDFDRVWFSTFAIFGWMNLQAPTWVYIIWNVIVLTALLGGAQWAILTWRRHQGGSDHSAEKNSVPAQLSRLLFHPAVILLGWFSVVALAWLQFMLRTPADQGRLFFPALIPMALGTAFGLSRWPKPWTQAGALTLALATSVYCLFGVIRPAYAPPPIVRAVPAGATPLNITFDEGLSLLGATVDTPAVRAGEWVWLTLYWQARAGEMAHAPQVDLELFGRGYERIGRLLAYHGRGNYPATLWPDGGIIADRIAVRSFFDSAAPVEARLTVRLSEDAPRQDVATVKLMPDRWPERLEPIATMGDVIELASADLPDDAATPGGSIPVRLQWQVIAPPGPALFHVFVHVGDPTQQPLAQYDGPIMAGPFGPSEYPPHLWEAGEGFEDTVRLTLPEDLPPGEYPIQVGVYDFASGNRLPVMVADERQPNDTLRVGRIIIR